MGEGISLVRDMFVADTMEEAKEKAGEHMVNYMRWVGEQGQEASRRREAGLPVRRGESERFEQVDKATFARNRALQEAKSKVIESGKYKSFGGLDDLMGRVFGRRKSTDLPYTNR